MIRPLADDGALAEVLAAPRAVIYKHSPRCGVCVASQQAVTAFAEAHPTVPVYQIDVVAHPGLADRIGRRLAVRHESPQVILLATGTAAWHASHWEITAAAIEEQAARVPGP